MIRVAINGFGRIGRCVLRAITEAGYTDKLEVVAINELADPQTLVYLANYDSTHGKFPGQISQDGNFLLVNGHRIQLLNTADLASLPWRELDVDLVFECTGSFTDRKTAEQHLQSGAKKVLFSQPADRDMDATIVFGVNEQVLAPGMHVVSAASCTTNAVVPVIDCIQKAVGIDSGMIRTMHAAMHDQPVIDAYHSADLRKTRAAFESLIPVETGLAAGIERILPALEGRFAATAMRIPVSNVSAIDLTLSLSAKASVAELNAWLEDAAKSSYQGVLGFMPEPLVSCDFVHDSRSGVVDAAQTTLAGERLAKMLIWFDNEWGYANRMLDVALEWHSRG